MDLDAAEVGHVDEGRLVLAEEVGNIPVFGLGADARGLQPAGRDVVDVLLKEGLSRDAAGVAV
jgi:hypothetical protein